ncbi:DnaJ C-terminal domain-containing protein [Blastococcus deserti]|uniref:DnaJ C-terminal domain-containing protein n=1 Tax=Blastococcus deserti TaxID=2259033 RepID=A0ABW4X9B4_9ACTN
MAATAEWLDQDYYRVLGVPETASDKEITRAYRRLARRLHPDTNGGGGDAQRFGEVTAAYDVLHDPEKRREYDEARRFAASRRSAGAPPWPHGVSVRVNRSGTGTGPGRARRVSVENLFGGDPGQGLGAVFGDAFAGSRTGPAGRPRRGADVEAELELPFEEAVRGTTRALRVGSQTVTARIPAGVADGQTIRLPGHGEPGTDGGPPGDLRIRIRVAPHPLFGRSGRDLTVSVPVTFPEAVLGVDIAVPTLDGPVTVRVPPGTRSGATLRVRGRGVPPSGRAGGNPGDLLVTVEVDVPRQLDERQRAAVEALAQALPQPSRAHPGV